MAAAAPGRLTGGCVDVVGDGGVCGGLLAMRSGKAGLLERIPHHLHKTPVIFLSTIDRSCSLL